MKTTKIAVSSKTTLSYGVVSEKKIIEKVIEVDLGNAKELVNVRYEDGQDESVAIKQAIGFAFTTIGAEVEQDELDAQAKAEEESQKEAEKKTEAPAKK